MPELPQKHLSEMKELLQDEYDDYLASFENKRVYGLRINTSKISVRDFLKINPFHLERIPWTDDGFYYDEEDRPAKHPYYFAGLYYLQEPSAMLPAEVLPVEENDLVLDCCAAPGGKSSKLANKLNNTGVLIANDISASRAQVLLKTLESQGIRNAYVMAEDITKIERFKECFDKILIDAPCSGEGMFRKESELISSWEERKSDYYSPIQKQLILKGVEMLKSGGKLVYSTCTFSPEEDEEIIEEPVVVTEETEEEPAAEVTVTNGEAEVTVSLDSMIKEIGQRDALVEAVKPLIGDNAKFKMMSAKEVAKYACDKLDLKVTNGQEDLYCAVILQHLKNMQK